MVIAYHNPIKLLSGKTHALTAPTNIPKYLNISEWMKGCFYLNIDIKNPHKYNILLKMLNTVFTCTLCSVQKIKLVMDGYGNVTEKPEPGSSIN